MSQRCLHHGEILVVKERLYDRNVSIVSINVFILNCSLHVNPFKNPFSFQSTLSV